MIGAIRRSFGLKLFLSYLLVVLVGIGVLGAATALAIPSAFNRQLGGMQQMVGGQGGPPEGRGPGAALELYENFRASFNAALAFSILAAVAAAVLASLLVSRGIVRPLRAMMGASQRIAAGHYSERVAARPGATDELGQLAQRFNQMAAQLEQAEAMRRQLIGDVAHELRTPLTAIKGSMEGLVDGVLPADAETFEQVGQEADRLSRLVDDLQELSRVEAGAYSLERRPVAPAALAATVAKRFEPQFAARGIRLAVSLPGDLPEITVDEDRVVQVLSNLVSNALHYTPAGGTVEISAARGPGELRVVVRDTGIGIPAEHLPNVFARFYRVDKSRSRAAGGSGIGLTIAKHLVEAHGGRIWAESEGAGKGSTFTFALPL